jgi:AcrR family transcriptional regulator
MARPRRHERQDTHALALARASELLHLHGYLGLSMDDVATGTGVRKASLYHHFPGGKEQMVLELAMNVMQDFETRLLAALEGVRGVRAQLTAVIRWRQDGPVGTERRIREAAAYLSAPGQAQIFTALMGQLFTHIEAIFLNGIRDGELRPHNTRLISTAFMAVLSELSELGQPLHSAAEIHEVLDLFLGGVGAARTDP